jgi:hypothetical protein
MMTDEPPAKRSVHWEDTPLNKALGDFRQSISYALGMTNALSDPTFISIIQGTRVSTYKHSLNLECTHVAPAELRRFSIQRDQKGKIISIGDDKTIISGSGIQKILALEAARQLGAQYVILEESGHDISALVIPKGLQIVTMANSEADKYGLYQLYTMKQRTKSFLTQSELEELLKLPLVKLSQVQSLVTAFNAVKEMDKDFTIEPSNWANPTFMRHQLNDADLKERQRTLFSKLISLAVLDKSYEERVQEFANIPSCAFAQDLNLTGYHRADLWSKSTRAKVPRVKLASLTEGARVVLSTIKLDAKHYNELPTVRELELFEWQDDLCVFNNKGNAKEVRSILPVDAEAFKDFINAAKGKPSDGSRGNSESLVEAEATGRTVVEFNL